MFERIIAGKDIATGTVTVTPDYRTVGPAESTFREGNATVQYEVLPANATYDTITHVPSA